MYRNANGLARRFAAAIVLILCLLTSYPGSLVCSAELSPEETALKIVPADASGFSSSLQLATQLETVLTSNAFAKLQEHPVVSFGLAQVQGFWQAQAETFQQWSSQPENQELLDLLKDSFSHEIFSYGDRRVAEWLRSAFPVAAKLNTMQLRAQLETSEGASEEEVIKELVLALLDDVDSFEIPGSVIGFKTTMADAANRQIDRLYQLASAAIEGVPELAPLQGRLKRQDISGQQFIVLDLDSSMIPWDEIDEQFPADLKEKLREKFRNSRLSICLGVVHGYIVLGIGPDTRAVERLGSKENLLSVKEMKPLRDRGRSQYESISYTSGDIMQTIRTSRYALEAYSDLAKRAVSKANVLKPEMKAALARDIDTLKDQLVELEPEFRAMASYSFLTEHGYEGYQYDWSENLLPVPEKPLKIVDYVGGSPICVWAGRAYTNREADALSREWIRRGLVYADQIIRQHLEEEGDKEASEEYQAVVDKLSPLLPKMEQIVDQKMFPAFDGAEIAFVLDAEARDDQWHAALPPGDGLPMLEIAMVHTTNDKRLAQESIVDLFELAQTAVERVAELDDSDNIPFDTIPAPVQEPFLDGVMYSYRLPPQAQLSPEIRPNLAIANDLVIMSLMPQTTRRLASKSALDVPAVFSGSDRPFLSISYFSFSKLVRRVREWIEFGSELNGADISAYRLFFDVAECFEGVSSASYFEGDVTVTHFDVRFKDLE